MTSHHARCAGKAGFLVALVLGLAHLPGASALAFQGTAQREPVAVFCFGRVLQDGGDPEKTADRQRGIDDSVSDFRAKLRSSEVFRLVSSREEAEVQVEVLGREGSMLMPKRLSFQVHYRGRATPLSARTDASWKGLIGQAQGSLERWATNYYYEIKGLPRPQPREGEVLPEVQAQIEELGKKDAVTRARAATRLAAMGPAALLAVPALIKILNDRTKLDYKLRFGTTTPGERAAIALIDIGALDKLVEAFRTSDSFRVREHAVYGLGNSPDGSVEAPLSEALRDRKGEVRRAAAFAFDYLRVERARLRAVMMRPKDPRALDALIAALQDKDRVVRKYSAGALGWRRDVRSLEPLIERLDDKGDIREKAAQSLERITGQKLGGDQAAWRRWLREKQEAASPEQ